MIKTQICTTRKQSEKLLSLGLKKETADMVWHYTNSRSELLRWKLKPFPPTLKNNCRLNIEKLNVFGHKNADGSIMSGEEYFDAIWSKDIPAWSLHRLLALIEVYMVECIVEDAYEVTINLIEDLIRSGKISKRYLEDV